MSDRPWIPHKPEQRLSIVVSRFLNDALVPPFYVTAIHDADEGTRTDRQRARDKQRGQEPGQLDWDVWQGPPCLARKLELKRGTNKPSGNQIVTIGKLTDLGARPVVAWDLRQVHAGLAREGFRFAGNVETLLQKHEAALEALDRQAELTLGGAAPAKKTRSRKAGPRYTTTVAQARRLNARGLV